MSRYVAQVGPGGTYYPTADEAMDRLRGAVARSVARAPGSVVRSFAARDARGDRDLFYVHAVGPDGHAFAGGYVAPDWRG